MARGATSSAIWSSSSFALSSWRMPIAELTIAISPKSASANRPWLRTRRKKTSRMPLKSVKTFAKTIDFTERPLSSGGGPSSRRRRSASMELSPSGAVAAVSGTEAIYTE